jgi:hypothetical protein
MTLLLSPFLWHNSPFNGSRLSLGLLQFILRMGVTASHPTTTTTTTTTRDLTAPWNGEIEIAMLVVPAVYYSAITPIVDDIKKASAA